MDRTGFIGASEVSTILGLNPFCTPLKLYSLKLGIIQPEPETESQEWGKRLERVVSQKFSEKHNVKLIARKTRYVHPKYSFISCELDNLISSTDELAEIKTVSAYAWKTWEKPDELPQYIIIQVMTQLGLSKRKKAWVACLCGGQKYIEKEILFDQELYDMIIGKCVAFWKMVQDKTPPMASYGDDEVLVALFPQSSDAIKEADETLNEALAHYLELSGHISTMGKEKDEIKASIMQTIGDNKGIKTSKYKVLRIDIAPCEYVVKKEATWYPRVYLNKKEVTK